jgi:hypothetical protein
MALAGGMGAREGYRAVGAPKESFVLLGDMSCAWDH